MEELLKAEALCGQLEQARDGAKGAFAPIPYTDAEKSLAEEFARRAERLKTAAHARADVAPKGKTDPQALGPEERERLVTLTADLEAARASFDALVVGMSEKLRAP